jgi:hypothetical protein
MKSKEILIKTKFRLQILTNSIFNRWWIYNRIKMVKFKIW